ncbi:hypothetical protein NP493_682g01019 [Ridgeia piscesae]|uniref:Protein kinase domain-containing protein n=1 Tax=Ridgeia piscesae TaxID=27915 RepID=A0AAD9KRE3_RIDPI|nr:hypothetical protein NP493_682g01019 [Ridgeia piscesae]
MWELFSSGDRPHGNKTSKQSGNLFRTILQYGISQSVDDERYYSVPTWGHTETNATANYDKLLMQPVLPPNESSVRPLLMSPSSSAGAASDMSGWSGSCDSRTPLLPTTRLVSDTALRGQQRRLPDLPPDSHQVLQREQLCMYKDKQLGKGLYGVVYKEICGECCGCIVVAGPLWRGVQGDLWATMAWCTRRSVVSVVVALLLQGHYGVVYKEICGPLWRGVQGDLWATMAWCTRRSVGHYGVVYKGALQVSGDTRSVAVKSLHAKMYNRYVEEFEKEIKMMQTLSHENIVKVIGYLPQRDSGCGVVTGCDVVTGCGVVTVLTASCGMMTVLMAGCGMMTVLMAGCGMMTVLMAGCGMMTVLMAGCGMMTVLMAGCGMMTVLMAGCENPMLLVMEYVSKGCLSHYLHRHKDSLAQNKLLTFGQEIAEGMKYLHSKDIIHRDLAARNILVTSNENMKISDFGLARILSPERDYYKSDATKEIPAAWCAPEALFSHRFSRESDVWSYGIILWEVYSFGTTPSLCDKFHDIVNVLHEGHRLLAPEGCPPDVYQLMKKCWEYYPEQRIHFDKILYAIVGLKSNLPIWDHDL